VCEKKQNKTSIPLFGKYYKGGPRYVYSLAVITNIVYARRNCSVETGLLADSCDLSKSKMLDLNSQNFPASPANAITTPGNILNIL